MAWSEDFHSIVIDETEELRSKYGLSIVGKSKQRVRLENHNVFIEFWYDRDRNHFVDADIGLHNIPAELEKSYSAYSIENFYKVYREQFYGDDGLTERDSRFPITPQVRAISAVLVATADRIFAGDTNEFVRLHYYSSGWSGHYTKMMSERDEELVAASKSGRDLAKLDIGLYVFISILIGTLFGIVLGYFDIWEQVPMLRETL